MGAPKGKLHKDRQYLTAHRTTLGTYWQLNLPEHPAANKRGRVYLHRWIAEQKLGRFLRPGEVVHHMDKNPENNDPANLLVIPRPLHAAIHYANLLSLN